MCRYRTRGVLLTIAVTMVTMCCVPVVYANDFLDSMPAASTRYTGSWHTDSVKARLGELPLERIEGLWRMSDDGALLAIERCSNPSAPTSELTDGYRIVMVKSPLRHPRPGTLVGYATPTAKSGVYEARIYTALTDRLQLERARRFMIHIDNSGNRFTLRPVRKSIKVNLWRMLPYMFRYGIQVKSDRPEDVDGALRVFPLSDAEPLTPRYL